MWLKQDTYDIYVDKVEADWGYPVDRKRAAHRPDIINEYCAF